MLQIESAAGPEVQEIRTLLRSKTWDLRNKASDEKAAASRHFPLMLLRSMRLVHTTDTQVKQMSRRYLAWVRNLYSYLGKNKMTKVDGNDMAKTSTYYKGVADRLSMVQSGVFINVERPWAAEGSHCGDFAWLLPKGKPGCGFYRTIKSKPAPRTKKKRKAAQKPSSNKATRKRQRRESHSDSEGDSYSSESEGDESASESGSDAGSGDDRERGSIALQRTVTMDEEFIMERIVEGPRETDGKYRIRWEG